MNIKDILDFEEKASNGYIPEFEIEEHLDRLSEYLSQKAEEGKDIVVSKMSEETFVRLIREVKRALMVTMLSNKSGGLLTIADMAGELDPFIHTAFLSILAILAEEEVV
jgi:hypothetical protein